MKERTSELIKTADDNCTNALAVKKVILESTEAEVLDTIIELVKIHGLTITTVRGIFTKVISHMLENATIKKD